MIIFQCNYQKWLQGRCKLFLCTSNLPRHVLAANCHLQGVTHSSQVTPVLSVPQMDVGYDLLSMASFHGSWPFIPLAFTERDDSLPFSVASSIPLCYIIFP